MEGVAVTEGVVFEELLIREVCLPVGLGPHSVGTVCEPLGPSTKGDCGAWGQALDEEVMFAREVGGA